jgi:hypothetical protein
MKLSISIDCYFAEWYYPGCRISYGHGDSLCQCIMLSVVPLSVVVPFGY